MMQCKDCDREKPESQFRGKLCKICFATRYYKYPLKGTKTTRIEAAYGEPIDKVLARMRIDLNMKVGAILQKLGISKKTYLRYFPREYIGYKRLETQEDIEMRKYWAKHARQIKLKNLVRKQKPKSDGWSWHKDMGRFFAKRKTS